MIGSRRGALWVGVVVGMALAAAGAGRRGSAEAADLEVAQPVLDLGQVVAGREAVATFVLSNPSDRDIRVLSAKPS